MEGGSMNIARTLKTHRSLRSNLALIAQLPLTIALALATGLVCSARLSAQQPAPTPAGEAGAPPPDQTSAVRLSDVEGQVQLSHGAMILASQALANTPVFEGTLITTADDGRAELQFDDGSVVRITPDSALLISVLRHEGSNDQSELDLQRGLAYFELQSGQADDSIRVRFSNNVVTTSGFTVMRVRMDTPPGAVSVFSGNAHLDEGTALSLDLHGGESVALNAADPSQYQLAETIEPDSWDAWNSDRDEALTSAEAQRTAPNSKLPDSNNPAWSDLDTNGNWYNVPGQGYVWSPYEAQNSAWDPYGCGSWMWTPNFGYMWVSCESWGYMPYMSGMWNYYDGFGWGWTPGYGGGPWWSTGGGWASNIGHTSSLRYQPPHRPRGGPIKPPAVSAFPRQATYQPHAIVSVNRLRNFDHAAPIRPEGAPLKIAGSTVEPMRPVAPRQRNEYSAFGETNSTVHVYPGTGTGRTYGFAAAPQQGNNFRPSFTPEVNANGSAMRTPSPSGTYAPRPEAPNYSFSAPRSYSPQAPSRGSSAPAPSFHSSGGGGGSFSGGGAPHVSSGGGASFGGGGGGGAHPSGGGGGGSPHR
jgi:Family of unknown function (DUF6600)/FecR protein